MKDNTASAFRKLLKFFDFGSLKIRLWFYFGLFAVILIVMLWILQVFFLNYSYEDMKTSETRSIASQIEARILENELSPETRSFINQICRDYEMYIQIETQSGVRRFMPNIDTTTQTDASGNQIEELPTEETPRSYYPTIYRKEIETLKAELAASGQPNYSKQTLEPNTDQKTLEYASFLITPEPEGAEAAEETQAPPEVIYIQGAGDEMNTAPGEIFPGWSPPAKPDPLMLFVFSPLYPVGSTVKILTQQLIYVTIIALLLALLIGFYLSRMITKPIIQIAERAEELGDGNFGIDFPSTHYSEVNQLAETLTYTSETLAETRTIERDIIANVSHDLRTPLTMIRSYAEMIHDFSGDDPEKREAHLSVIMDETERLSAMIAELLDISRLQSGEKQIRFTDFSLKDLIEATIASYSAFVEQDGYKLVFVSMGEGVVRADETRIKQVLDNLISNALKYGGKDKTVEIRMVESKGLVRCEVTDFGIGISKRDLKHIWDRYYQTSAHHSRTDSTGLGLSIVKEILVLHKARFGVRSALRKGSTFWFELRTTEDAQPEVEIGG
ncbi:MAG: HAMP domain-containing histidine kinase [Clostridiales Family XIII bacterium]|nr:HAMP domain-containing histidine kinase [Clostridiales Family XIII bacterium]